MRRPTFVWPVVLITAGVLFLLDEFTRYDFDRTWPILLIAIGLALVAGRSMPAGQVAPQVPTATAPETSSDKVNHV